MGVRNQAEIGARNDTKVGVRIEARLGRSPVCRIIATLALALALAVGFASAAHAAVDANTATAAELDAISGIGPALAARIVEERRNSPFRSLDDLQSRVRGIGEANLRRMREGGLAVGAGRDSQGTQTIVGGMDPAPRGAQAVGAQARRAARAAVK